MWDHFGDSLNDVSFGDQLKKKQNKKVIVARYYLHKRIF